MVIVKTVGTRYTCIEVQIYDFLRTFIQDYEEKGITTYTLINKYNISRGLIDRLKHNRPITTVTLNDLCTILDCKVEDVMVYTKDE